MTGRFEALWVYLSASPLLFLFLTLVAYQIGVAVQKRAGGSPLLNPVLVAVLLLVGLLQATGTPFARYFEGAQFVHFLLGPATVALAVPLYSHLHRLRGSVLAVSAALLIGSLTAAASAVAVAWALGAGEETLRSIAAKSVTTPIAMGITEQLGGLPSLAAVLVILTGILGAMLGTHTLNLLGITDWRARGLAVGTAAHGIGTARAIQVNEIAGAFAGLAMGLNALATAVLLPLIYRLIAG
ncbi:MAG: LrgB family protein [Alphaproteobacteria bacterium]|nr:LrgB family protein [Alphaproteobacteria bacterium]TAD91185.1 MAG: LrgB family protein [Alphaproteobacteria bacterium]